MIERFLNYIADKTKPYIIFDIGSRDCLQSIEFYNHFPNARIYAFECNPNTLDICKKNIENYKDRITLIEGAVCDYDGEITFYPINQQKTITTWEDGNPGASSLFKSNGTYTTETYVQDEIITNCHRLDTIMKVHNIPCVNIIWMDLQGAELLALKGLGSMLADVQYIHTEACHSPMYTNQALFSDIHKYLTNYYKFTLLSDINPSGVFEDVIYENKFIKDPIYPGIDLSVDEQTYIRGKPKEYLLHTINLFKLLTAQKIIFEVGSARSTMGHTIDEFNPQCCNDGHSTYFWKHFTTADIFSVDIEPNCKCLIDGDVRLNGVNAVTDDAIHYATTFDKKIDLLFLDAWDVVPSNPYAEKHLEIYNILKFKLSDTSLILIDDTDIGNGGKGRLVIPELLKDGFQCILKGRQSLFIKLPKSEQKIFDIIIPLGPNDVSLIQKQIECTKKNVIGYRNIYLLSYDDSIQIDGVITISEKIFPFNLQTISDIHGESSRNGWYLQQLLKLYAGFVIPGILDKYLVIDADTFFLKPTEFYKDGKSLYNYGTENYDNYFIHLNKLYPELRRMDEEKSGICHHMMFETTYLRELFDIIENLHRDVFFNVFLKNVNTNNSSGASEYELYFNFLLLKHSNEITIRKLTWKNIEKELTLDEDCDYVSFHFYSR